MPAFTTLPLPSYPLTSGIITGILLSDSDGPMNTKQASVNPAVNTLSKGNMVCQPSLPPLPSTESHFKKLHKSECFSS